MTPTPSTPIPHYPFAAEAFHSALFASECAALRAGYYHSPGWNRDYQHLQIRTVAQLLAGQSFDHPPTNVTWPRPGGSRSRDNRSLSSEGARGGGS